MKRHYTPSWEMDAMARYAREINDLRRALRIAGKRCDQIHHEPGMQHVGPICPAERWLNAMAEGWTEHS